MSDSRLFKILYYLLDKGHATAPELAAEFEVSPRTIYRDVEALSTSYPNRCNKNMIGKTTGNTANSQDLIDKRQCF